MSKAMQFPWGKPLASQEMVYLYTSMKTYKYSLVSGTFGASQVTGSFIAYNEPNILDQVTYARKIIWKKKIGCITKYYPNSNDFRKAWPVGSQLLAMTFLVKYLA